jgi:hypothetical protein
VGQRIIFWPRAVRIPGQNFEGFTTTLPGGKIFQVWVRFLGEIYSNTPKLGSLFRVR